MRKSLGAEDVVVERRREGWMSLGWDASCRGWGWRCFDAALEQAPEPEPEAGMGDRPRGRAPFGQVRLSLSIVSRPSRPYHPGGMLQKLTLVRLGVTNCGVFSQIQDVDCSVPLHLQYTFLLTARIPSSSDGESSLTRTTGIANRSLPGQEAYVYCRLFFYQRAVDILAWLLVEHKQKPGRHSSHQ